MRTWKVLAVAVALLGTAVMAGAETLDLANYAPSDSKAVIETVNAAGLREMLLESKFWAALEGTQAFKDWRASQRYDEAQERIERLLANLDMTREAALKAYLGGRSAVVVLPGAEKPRGVILTEATADMARRLVKACGGVEVKRHRDVAVHQVEQNGKTDRMAFTKDILLASAAEGDELERVLDVIVGGGASMGTEGHFALATKDLPTGWRFRAYGDEVPPRKGPGAIAMYPGPDGRVHAEWRLVSAETKDDIRAPEALTSPAGLPATSAAAIATVLHPAAIWTEAKAKLAAQGDPGIEQLRKAEMFVRGWFAGQTMDGVLAAFGPEAAAAVVKNDQAGGAPGVVIMVRLAQNGKAVATAFKDGLAAKAMLVAAMSQNQENAPKINVRDETYHDVPLLCIEASGAGLEKVLGAWAKDIALAVAVTDEWLIGGTTPSAVKQTIDTLAGNGKSLAASLKEAGETVPTAPATCWGVLLPQGGTEIVLSAAELLAGKARLEEAKKMTNLAELMNLVKYMGFQQTDGPTVISGQADVQAVK